MIEVPALKVDGVLPPSRQNDGTTQLGRASSTDEQETQAIDFLKSALHKAGESEGKMVVEFTRADPLVLILSIGYETLTNPRIGKVTKIPVNQEVRWQTLQGAEIRLSRSARARRLVQEVDEMVQAGDL